MHIRTKLFGALVFSVLALASRVDATEVLTTSFNSWKATASSNSEWNFVFTGNGSYSSVSGYSLNMSSGSYGTTTVTGPDGAGYSLNKTGTYGSAGNSVALQGASDGTGSLVFTTPAAGLTAFLLGIGITGNAAPVTVTLSDGEAFTVNPAVNGVALLGLSSATAITSFTITTSAGTAVDLTDFFAGVSNEPANATSSAAEVTTGLMIGSGLLLFGSRRKIFSNVSGDQS